MHYQNELLAVTYFLEYGENKDYPAVKIGRLGVSKIYQHNLKNGFMFMGTDERLRYESGTAATVAMYYDLKHIC